MLWLQITGPHLALRGADCCADPPRRAHFWGPAAASGPACGSEERLQPLQPAVGRRCGVCAPVRGSLPRGERSSLCHTDSCLSCGRRNPATFHPLFEGGLCQTCRVSAAVPELSRGWSLGCRVQPRCSQRRQDRRGDCARSW